MCGDLRDRNRCILKCRPQARLLMQYAMFERHRTERDGTLVEVSVRSTREFPVQGCLCYSLCSQSRGVKTNVATG
jgi:hypothetical protein